MHFILISKWEKKNYPHLHYIIEFYDVQVNEDMFLLSRFYKSSEQRNRATSWDTY